jgi:methyl-accepting chemotaxis protein
MSSVTQQPKGKKRPGLNSVISWGASVVIIGLMFKILHWKGGEFMIAAGLLTESFLFFILGFAAMDVVEAKPEEGKGAQPETMGDLLSAAITPKVVERLAKGFEQFNKTVESVAVVASAGPITQKMLTEMESATGDLKKFRDQMGVIVTNVSQFGKTMQDMNTLSAASQTMIKDFDAVHNGMKSYAANITTMNASFDQFNKTISAINAMTSSSQAMLKEFEAATNGMKSYNKSITDLSRVYQAQLEAFRKN